MVDRDGWQEKDWEIHAISMTLMIYIIFFPKWLVNSNCSLIKMRKNTIDYSLLKIYKKVPKKKKKQIFFFGFLRE